VLAGGPRAWSAPDFILGSTCDGLPEIEKLDRRYKPPRLHRAVEVEALGQGVVTGIVRDALDELLPEPLGAVLDREQVERDEWRERLNG
jgi:hypothetical protein